ncbi:hypothetical protein C8Q80DRAFT_1353562 [Daedaleopsis nitida]|nr:hypothetical protein C8Q80DRAFT_1353562 [Daedaleopsis nitida]
MSSSDSADAVAIIAEFSALVIENYSGVSVYALALYEYFITLTQEVELFWRSGLNGAALLFYMNRYFYLVRQTAILVTSFISMSDGVVPAVPIVFSALRAFALSRSALIGIIVFLLSSVTIGMNMSLFRFGITGENVPIIGCQSFISASPLVFRKVTAHTAKLFMNIAHFPVSIISRTCLMAADILLVYITWKNLRRRGSSLSELNGIATKTFTGVLLRDGTIYFAVLFTLNALHLTLTLLSELDISLENISIVTFFTDPFVASLTMILVSRFLLDLQAAERKAVGLTSSTNLYSTRSYKSSLVFERVVGSIGSVIVSEEGDEDMSDTVYEDSYQLDDVTETSHAKDASALPELMATRL